MPEVTVLMSVYNGMPYLPEAVDSILQQTFGDFTFLVINDGSTDGSEEYLDRLSDPRIEIMHQSHRGLGAALNQGLDICGTEFLARMDADDVALPCRLQAQLAFLRRHKEIGMLGTQIAYLGVGGRRGLSPPMPSDHETIFVDLLRGHLAICHTTVMCQTSRLKEIGGYPIDGIGEDWDLFLRMGEASKLANLEEILQLVRLHSCSVSGRCLAQIRWQIAFASHCAKRRAEGRPEITFDEFAAERCDRPFWERAAEKMDVYALAQYRCAMLDILSSHPVNGYSRLVWATLCSPRRTAQRIGREIHRAAGIADRGLLRLFSEAHVR